MLAVAPAIEIPSDATLDHPLLVWASTIGSRVARHYRLRGSERDEILAESITTLIAYTAVPPSEGGFNPERVPKGGNITDAFKGLAYLTVRCACVREAKRIRNGGTFRTSRTGLVLVAPLGDAAEMLPDDEPTAKPDYAGAVMLDEKPAGHYGRTFRSVRKAT